MSELSGVRIIVVEDDEDSRFLLKTFLSVCGAEVNDCESAVKALNAIRESKPDVVVSDIKMPEHDGYWLIKSIRHLEPGQGRGIPAIAVTAETQEQDRARALEAGFELHIPKPALSNDLVSAIKRLAEKRRRAR